jgi:hypothetical protein
MLQEHRRRFANGLPAPDPDGPGKDRLGIRGSHLVVQNRLNELTGKGLIRTASDEVDAERRVNARRQKLLPIAALSGRSMKGHEAGARALQIALEIVSHDPDVRRRDFERLLVHMLWLKVQPGPYPTPNPVRDEAGNVRLGDDPLWRAGRLRALRAVKRGARDAGEMPAQLRGLICLTTT